MLLEKLEVSKIASYDVIVAGGGVAGIAAALACTRSGCRTLLFEKSVMLGGLATLGIINYFEPLCDGHGRKIIGGLCEELLRLSIKYGYDTVPGPWRKTAEGVCSNINPEAECKDPANPPRYVTRFSPAIFAMYMTEYLTSEGVDILFDTLACKPVINNECCEGVTVENKSGRQFYGAKVVIDTTGDADLIYRAGIPTITGDNWFTYCGRISDLSTCDKAIEEKNIYKALKSFTIGSDLYGKGHPEGMKKFDGTDVNHINEYIRQAHKKTIEFLAPQDRTTRDVVMIPSMPQFRTTRRIVGEYELTEQDQYVHFDDSVGAICDFTKRDIVYEVPYRCLYNKCIDNMITAGRSISSSGWAWDVTRVIPPAILTGQAAGQAATVSIRTGKPLRSIPVNLLQQELADTGILIHF